jgi:dihydropteroate synthase
MNVEAAIARAVQMVEEGADVIDIGGESTRPGFEPVSAEEEIDRVVPVIRALREARPEVVLSIDTSKARVAEVAVGAGADMINDVWGLKGDSAMAAVAAACRCPVFLMHNRTHRHYDDFWGELVAELNESVDLARSAGVEERQIWLDPGFGFGKEPWHNLEVVRHLDRVAALGFPVLLGTSRKSTLGLVLDRPPERRLEGSVATAVWGISRGCRMIRAHDVAETVPFLRMADAIARGLDYCPPGSADPAGHLYRKSKDHG